ncbi:MAG: sigma-70 family RNA polymerase sigma factor [Clostridia bacterium]|nr:sigma-70 family RNA polymerase sigma factor [Clostridia bacterium]
MKKETFILNLLKDRSERALEEIDRAYGKRCLQLAKDILHNDQDAEECVNDAYLRLWTISASYLPESLESYLYKTVRNACLNRIRQNSTARRGGEEDDVPLHELEYCLAEIPLPEDDDALRQMLNRFLSTLERRDMLLFVRRYWYSDSIQALSAASGMKENTIHQRLHKIRKKLRQYLTKGGISL